MKRRIFWFVAFFLLCAFVSLVYAQPEVMFQDKTAEGWMKLLNSENWADRSRAARFLGSIGNRDAIPLLKKALNDEHASVRKGAILSLQRLNEKSATPLMIKALTDPNKDVKEGAYRFLCFFKVEEARPLLYEWLMSKNSSERFVAIKSEFTLSEPSAVTDLIKILEKDDDLYMRQEAARALGRLKAKKAVPVLLKNYKKLYGFDFIRMASLRALGDIADKSVVPELAKMLEEQLDTSERWEIASALGKIGGVEAIGAIIRQMKKESIYPRHYVRVLGDAGDKSVIPELVKLLVHKREDVRLNTVYALGKLGSKKALPGLFEALEQGESEPADILGDMGDKSAIPKLIAALKFENSVFLSSSMALIKLKAKSAVPALLERMKNPDHYVRNLAIYAAARIGGQVVKTELKKALQDGHDSVRITAAEQLGLLGDKSGIPALINALTNRWDEYPLRARKVLREITGKDFGTEVDKWKGWWSRNK